MSKMNGADRKCAICGVREEQCIEKKFFARFPLNEEVCKQWVKVVGKEDFVYLPIEKLHDLRYVCGDHFKKRDFTKSKTRLKRKAIPSLGLTTEPLSDDLFKEFPLHMYRSNQGSSVKKKAEIVSESDLLYGEELSDNDGLNQPTRTTPTTNAATADDTQPATPSVEIVDNETTTIIFPLTDDFLTQTTPVPVSSIVTEIVTDPVPANYLMPSEVLPLPSLNTIENKTAAQFFMEFSDSHQISPEGGPEFGVSSDVSSAPEVEHDYCLNLRRKRRYFKAYGPEMVAFYHKQWLLVRKKLHHQSLLCVARSYNCADCGRESKLWKAAQERALERPSVNMSVPAKLFPKNANAHEAMATAFLSKIMS